MREDELDSLLLRDVLCEEKIFILRKTIEDKNNLLRVMLERWKTENRFPVQVLITDVERSRIELGLVERVHKVAFCSFWYCWCFVRRER